MLKELLDQFYLDRQKDREQHHFYITDAGKCQRAVFLKFKNAPRAKLEPHILRLYDRGDYLQMQILNAMFSLGIVRASEVSIPPQKLISGRADAIVTLNNELYVVDFKSMNSMVFRALTAPKEENVNQIQLYLHYFKIPKGILLYINKDTLELKEFLVKYDPQLANSLLKDLESLKEKLDSDIVPVRLPDYPQNWQCQYCPFKDLCKIAGEGDIPWKNLKSKIESLSQED